MFYKVLSKKNIEIKSAEVKIDIEQQIFVNVLKVLFQYISNGYFNFIE
jgi:hypothetical protein